jgi:hypothetical protein
MVANSVARRESFSRVNAESIGRPMLQGFDTLHVYVAPEVHDLNPWIRSCLCSSTVHMLEAQIRDRAADPTSIRHFSHESLCRRRRRRRRRRCGCWSLHCTRVLFSFAWSHHT